MYGQGNYNNQFKPSPLLPQFPSFQNAPPPPAPQIYPLATSSQNQPLPPPPPPPPSYQAPQLSQHDHPGHSTHHHVLPFSVPPPIPQATAPPQIGFVRPVSTVPPPPVHCGPLPPLPHVLPPALPASSHLALENFGQTYAASPTAHGSLMIPPPYSGSQAPSAYVQQTVPQNLQHGMLPPSPAVGGNNFQKVPAPPPPLPGPIRYRLNHGSQHGQSFPPPPPPPSYVPVAPTTFVPHGECPVTDAPPPPPLSPPLPPPPPPPSPPPLPTTASQQEVVSSPGHPVRDDQVMDTELNHGSITKSVQTENLCEILVKPSDSNLSKVNAQIPSSSPNKGNAMQAHKCGDVSGTFLGEKVSASLPESPPNPSKQEVARNMTLKEYGDPNFGLQHASKRRSSSTPASDKTKSTKQSIQHLQTSETSSHKGLTDREMMPSPSLSDMDMEDDFYSPTKDFPSDHLVDLVKGQPVPTAEHLLYEEQSYAPDSPTEQSPFQKTSLLVGASTASAKLDTKQEEEEQTFSPGLAFEDLSSASDSPVENDIVFDRTIHTSPIPPVENPQLKNPQEGIAKPCVGDVNSFKLLPNYASDDSSDEDVNPKIEDLSPVKASSEVMGSLNIAQDFCPNNSNSNSIEASEIEMRGHSQVVPWEVQNDACHSISSQPLSASLTMGLPPSSEHGGHGIDAVAVNLQHISFPVCGQLHQEKGALKPSSVPKVDEFGRMIRERESDSDSDADGQYSRRLRKRRRSHSCSLSPQTSRWRKTHSQRRRSARRIRSCSWSPKKERNRSKSPLLARLTGHSDEKTWRHRDHPSECFNFRRGRCFRGVSCRFLHRESVTDEPSRQYGTNGHHYSEKHQVAQDVPGTILEAHEAKERNGHIDMALTAIPTSNLLSREGASLFAIEVHSTATDAAHKVGEQMSKELQGLCQIQLPLEVGSDSPNKNIQNLVVTYASPNLSVETSSQVELIPEGKETPEAKLHEPTRSSQDLVAGSPHLQDDGTNVDSSVHNKDVRSWSPTAQSLMPPVEGGTPHLPKPVILSHLHPPESHSVTVPFTAESPRPQQLPTRDFQSFSTSGDVKLQPSGALASRDFPAETSTQHLSPPQYGHQMQLNPPQQCTVPSFQPTSDLWPFPSNLPRPPQSGLPLPTHVNELPLRHTTKAPDCHSPYRHNVEPLRNEFILQTMRRPHQSDESMRSQQIGFVPQAQAVAERHRPTLRAEDLKPWSFPSANSGDQSFGDEAFARDPKKLQEERFVYPTNAEGPKSEPLAFRPVVLGDQHSFPRPGSQLLGQPFNMPVAVSLGNSHSQPFVTQHSQMKPLDVHSWEGNPWDHHYPRERLGIQMHNFPREDMAPRAFARESIEGISSFRDTTYSGKPSIASSSLPPQDGGAPLLSQHLTSGKSPAFPEYPENFLTSNRSSLLSVIGRCQVPRTHYNPYASTFEEKPSKFEPQFDLSRVPFGAQIGSGLGSRSFGSSAVLPQVNKESSLGDQYDPLFDSIEPSKKDALSKFNDVQDRGTSFDAFARSNNTRTIIEPDFISRFGNNQMNLLNVEETSIRKGVEPIVSKQFDIDELGEATDAEAGAVENVSPIAGVEKYWSPDHAVDTNIEVDEVEIDQAHASDKGRKGKDSRSMKLFKLAVAEFVKDVLKPSWRQGNMSKEAFKTIVKKTVDKVSGAMQSHQVPKSKAKIDQYIESSQRKLTKLVMGYVDKYVKS